jgi:hypothetical protein
MQRLQTLLLVLEARLFLESEGNCVLVSEGRPVALECVLEALTLESSPHYPSNKR